MTRAGVERPVTIRPARVEDASEIATLSGQLGYPTDIQRMVGRLQELLAREEHKVLVAVEKGNCLAGWVHIYIRCLIVQDRHAELGGLVVAEAARGLGIGAALLALAETWAGSQGARLIIVRSNLIRTQAHQFYLRVGYERVKHSLVFHKPLV